MDRNKTGYDRENFKEDCRKMISKVLSACEAELLIPNENEKILPHAAMAVRESLLIFIGLISSK